nr:hypothetical protein [Tanacetum cinerariifolium]
MLHICPRVHGQSFAEPPFKEETLSFIRFLGHSAAIKTLTDVEHKNTKKSNEMYYPRFTKVIIHHFMSNDPFIPRRNKVNWHFVRDEHMLSTIKLVSRHQNMQVFGALLPIELTNEEIRNSNAYKEYYAIDTGAAPPKPKASVRRTRSSSDTSITPPTGAVGSHDRGTTAEARNKEKPVAYYISHASGSGVDEGIGSIPGVPDVPTDESEEELSWNSTDGEGDADEGKDGDDDEEDEGDDRDDDKDDKEEGENDEHEYDDDESNKETKDEARFDPIPQTP